MSKFIPRTDIPQPKAFQMDPPPKFTVPDVTHLFDSDDSLIWKPGENVAERSKKLNKIDRCKVTFVPLPQIKNKSEAFKNDTENADVNISEPVLEKHTRGIVDQNILRRLEYPTTTSASPITTTASPITTDSPTTTTSIINNNNMLETQEDKKFKLTKGYCPELYCSPKQNFLQQRNQHINLKSNIISNEIDKMKCFSHGQNVCPVNNTSDEIMKKIIGSVDKCNPQVTGILNRCECCCNQELLRNNHQLHFASVPNSCHPPIGDPSYQSDILKVIEKQNQHILYLQNVLEKLLQNSTSNHDTKSPKCNNCSDLEKSNCTKQDVGTQTSYSELHTNTKSVGTSTENQTAKKSIQFPSNAISHKDICNGNYCQRNDCDSQIFKYDVKKDSNKGRIFAHENDYRILKNINSNNWEPVYDSPSPKPVHMNVQEYNEDKYPDYRDYNYGAYRNGPYEEVQFSDAPLAGESAMMYNERYIQSQQFARNQNNDEIVPEDNDGVTFFNSVMINVKQVLHKSNIQEKRENKAYRNDCPAAGKMGATGAFYNINPTMQQLQQFGISFLDPVTLEDKRKPTERVLDPYEDAIYDELEVINAKNKRRPANHYTADSHLAFIAQNSRAMINGHRAHYVKDQERIAVDEGQKEAFSFATKQFLDRYKLEND